ncbi:hypothetical protein EGJ09_24990 [Pseudomonas sp. p106]|nr:hypothetical protein EGJ09_24990 [Pseudomonas sp. p106]
MTLLVKSHCFRSGPCVRVHIDTEGAFVQHQYDHIGRFIFTDFAEGTTFEIGKAHAFTQERVVDRQNSPSDKTI